MKKCKCCRDPFTPSRPMQSVCGPACAIERARAQKEQAERKKRSDQRKADRDRREKLKTLSDYIREAQIAVNSFVRLRDKQRGCISCGAASEDGRVGGGMDAGHYRSRGAAPHLRFDLRNIHSQCKRCNRYLSGNAAAYRVGLVERIGIGQVEALEADNEPRKWTREELAAITARFKAMTKELKNS